MGTFADSANNLTGRGIVTVAVDFHDTGCSAHF
jgi:hypothetical protein